MLSSLSISFVFSVIVVENLFYQNKMLRNSLRERYEKKRKERQDILCTGGLAETVEEKKSLIFGEGKENKKFALNFYI